jgi:hypothetical protein
MKKRFYLSFAGLFLLFCLVCGCSGNSPDPVADEGREQIVPDPDPEPDPDPDDKTDGGKEGLVPDPDPDDEEEENAPDSSARFLAAKVASEKEIVFEFTKPVRIVSLFFDPDMEIDSLEEGSTVTVLLEEGLEPGMRFTARFEVEDEWENTISMQHSLISINKRYPELLINELRTEFSGPQLRAEFIAFKILSDGNLGGLQVFVASNPGSPMIYEFKPAEVIKGEYVVLYLRTLGEPDRTDSFPTRSFWIPGSNKLLRNTDAVYVMNQDGQVLSAVMIAEHPDSSWNRDHFTAAAEFLFKQGAWKSPTGEVSTPQDAVSSSKTTVTRSISRDETVENTKTAADWFVTANSGATPGLPNSTARF